MTLTAIEHYDKILGHGYYLVSETMDKTWYKGDTPEDAARNFEKDTFIHVDGIIERK